MAAKAVARRAFVGGNWKSNGTVVSVAELVTKLNALNVDTKTTDVAVAPPALFLGSVLSTIRKDWIVSAQNVSPYGLGAFTGEIGASQLKNFGVEWTLVGHSERRHLFKEDDKQVTEKVKHALAAGVAVIACVGELLEERKTEKTLEVVNRQLKAVAEGVTKAEDWAKIVIAYEPVWAIGTGETATPAQAQAVHAALRATLKAIAGDAVANATRIIYGGSVNKGNADELFREADIDGFLVGGASLKADEFGVIVGAPARQSGAKKSA